MKNTAQKIIDDALQLDEGARALVAETLLESLDLGACRTFGATPLNWSQSDRFRWSYAKLGAPAQIERLRFRVGAHRHARSDRLLGADFEVSEAWRTEIQIRERVLFNGAGARGLVKTRVAVEDEAQARILGATEGNAAGARGHVDCLEIVRGAATASAVPEVRVTHPEAKVTHEASIGRVDERQIEALMARGLAPDDAVDRIVLGMLG